MTERERSRERQTKNQAWETFFKQESQLGVKPNQKLTPNVTFGFDSDIDMLYSIPAN